MRDSLYFDPLMTVDNMGQRYLIVKYLQWLRSYLEWTDLPDEGRRTLPRPIMRSIISGVAGTGKSAVISMIETITRMLTGSNDCTIVFAPTGAAAVSAGGRIPDREWKFNRQGKTYKQIEDMGVLVKRDL
jgi:hypothetical protein